MRCLKLFSGPGCLALNRTRNMSPKLPFATRLSSRRSSSGMVDFNPECNVTDQMQPDAAIYSGPVAQFSCITDFFAGHLTG